MGRGQVINFPSSFLSILALHTSHQLITLKDNRISSIELIIPPRTPGPPAHWHEMHDETFLVTKGTVTFYVPEAPGLEAKVVHAKAGDYGAFSSSYFVFRSLLLEGDMVRVMRT